MEQAYTDFRELFPSAMCHAQIVPVDEVVTMILYHREDEPLKRLMLSDAEAAKLDRLWEGFENDSESSTSTPPTRIAHNVS